MTTQKHGREVSRNIKEELKEEPTDAATEADELIVEEMAVAEPTEESAGVAVAEERGALSEVMSRAESAYKSYLGAQQEVAKSYRASEIQGQKAYKEAESQADRLCEQDLDLARSARDEERRRATLVYQTAVEAVQKAQQEAEQAYDNALQQLNGEYEKRVNEALNERSRIVMDAWVACIGRSEKAWTVYARTRE